MIKEERTIIEARIPAAGFAFKNLPDKLMTKKPSSGKRGMSQANRSMRSRIVRQK